MALRAARMNRRFSGSRPVRPSSPDPASPHHPPSVRREAPSVSIRVLCPRRIRRHIAPVIPHVAWQCIAFNLTGRSPPRMARRRRAMCVSQRATITATGHQVKGPRAAQSRNAGFQPASFPPDLRRWMKVERGLEARATGTPNSSANREAPRRGRPPPDSSRCTRASPAVDRHRA